MRVNRICRRRSFRVHQGVARESLLALLEHESRVGRPPQVMHIFASITITRLPAATPASSDFSSPSTEDSLHSHRTLRRDPNACHAFRLSLACRHRTGPSVRAFRQLHTPSLAAARVGTCRRKACACRVAACRRMALRCRIPCRWRMEERIAALNNREPFSHLLQREQFRNDLRYCPNPCPRLYRSSSSIFAALAISRSRSLCSRSIARCSRETPPSYLASLKLPLRWRRRGVAPPTMLPRRLTPCPLE